MKVLSTENNRITSLALTKPARGRDRVRLHEKPDQPAYR